MEKNPDVNNLSSEELETTAKGYPKELIKFVENPNWKFNKDIKTDKICKMYKMNMGDILASKGVVEDVEGTPS